MTTVVTINKVLTEEEEEIYIRGMSAGKQKLQHRASVLAEEASERKRQQKRIEDKAYEQGRADAYAHIARGPAGS